MDKKYEKLRRSEGGKIEGGAQALDWLMRQLDVPAHAEYLGFGIHRLADDLFLSAWEESGEGLKWSPSVMKALSFSGWHEALRVAESLAGARVVLMFDYGDEVWVFPAR